MKRILFSFALAALTAAVAVGQSGTNSPYSQYGLGILADPSQGYSRGMNGVGLALRKGNVVNTLNPASYAATDSLTMIFDMGLSGQVTNFKEGGKSLNANNADVEYAVGSFRLMPSVGMAFGLLPVTNIGYNYVSGTTFDSQTGTIPQNYSGSGGLRRVFVGAGWQVARPLSVGVNMGYLWGSYTRTVTSTGTTYVNSLSKSYTASVSSYSLEVGAQWQQPLGAADQLTVGLTWSVGHKLGADAECAITNRNISTGAIDTTTFVVSNALSLPTSLGLGLGWSHGQQLFVGADVTLQRWGSERFPDYTADANTYALRSDLLKDRWRVALGADYVPNSQSRGLLKRIHYRAGAGYATPYYKVNGQDGPKELTVSAGLGIPLQNGYNNRSVLNVGFQWGHTAADGLITENTFRINLGLTFNERWFAKWRVD